MHNKNSNNAYKITQVKLEVEKGIYDNSFVLLMLRWRLCAVEQDRLACGETKTLAITSYQTLGLPSLFGCTQSFFKVRFMDFLCPCCHPL